MRDSDYTLGGRRGKGGRQDDRRIAGQQEDSGMTGDSGQRETVDDGQRWTTAGDGRQRAMDDSTPATLGATLGTRRHGEGENGVAS